MLQTTYLVSKDGFGIRYVGVFVDNGAQCFHHRHWVLMLPDVSAKIHADRPFRHAVVDEKLLRRNPRPGRCRAGVNADDPVVSVW